MRRRVMWIRSMQATTSLRSARYASPPRGGGGGKKDKLQKEIYTPANWAAWRRQEFFRFFWRAAFLSLDSPPVPALSPSVLPCSDVLTGEGRRIGGARWLVFIFAV